MKKVLVICLVVISLLAINLQSTQAEKPVYYGPYLPAETQTVLYK